MDLTHIRYARSSNDGTRSRWRAAVLVALMVASLVGPGAAAEAQGCVFPANYEAGDEASLNAAIGCFNQQTEPGEYLVTLIDDIALTASTRQISNGNEGVSLRIDGAGHAVDGQGTPNVRVFRVTAEVVLYDITVTGGRYTPDNDLGAGGILNDMGGRLTIDRSTVTANRGTVFGGAIDNRGGLIVSHSTISENTVIEASFDEFVGGGGAIYNGALGISLVLNSSFVGNRSEVVGMSSPQIPGGGGAIFNAANLRTDDTEDQTAVIALKVINSTFVDNSTAGRGGAIANEAILNQDSFIFSATAGVYNSTFVGNSATGGGGAISNGETSQFLLSGSIFEGNGAVDCVGPGPRFAFGNVFAGTAGCGIDDGVNNQVGIGDAGLDPAGLADNGGPTQTIALAEDSPARDAGSNIALMVAADAVCLPFSGPSPGCLTLIADSYIGPDPSMLMVGDVTTDQRGDGYFRIGEGKVDAGAYEIQGPPCPASPVSVGDEPGLFSAVLCFNRETDPGEYRIVLTSDVLLSESTPPINNPREGVGLVIDGDGHTLDGGCPQAPGVCPEPWPDHLRRRPIKVAAGTSVTIERLTITGGSPPSGWTAVLDPGHVFEGGAILSHGSLTLRDSLVTQNQAGNGAGIYADGVLTIVDTTISENDANADGGGIRYDGRGGGMLTVTGSTIEGNDIHITGFGAGIMAEGRVEIARSRIVANSEGSGNLIFGSGISHSAGVLTISDSIISGNDGRETGGLYARGTTTVVDTTFEGNQSDTEGGAISNSGDMLVVNSTFVRNRADLGGAIHNGGGDLQVVNSTITDNLVTVATVDGFVFGSGLYITGGLVSLVNTMLAGNHATPPGARPADCTLFPDPESPTATLLARHSLVGATDSLGPCDVVDGVNGNIVGVAAEELGLDPAGLQDNGGLTPTLALLPGSPAVDAGDDLGAVDADGEALEFDQRGEGFPRIQGAAVDIGAYEAEVPPDTTPPEIAVDVAGTLGDGDWYVSDVAVTWTVTDAESPVTTTDGCDPTVIDSDTTGVTLTCEATSGGGTASESVTVKRDATAPTVAVTGVEDGAEYAPGEVPEAACDTEDATSGVATAATVQVTGAGGHDGTGAFTATCDGAADNAGNAAAAVSVTYTVAYPQWNPHTLYDTGDRVTHEGRVYEAAWPALILTPGASPWGPWQEIAEDRDGDALWTDSRIFHAGDVVVYEGATYRALWWTRNQEPGDPFGPWEEIATNADGVIIWTPSRVFHGGDIAEYEGDLYRAKWLNRNWPPGTLFSPWEPA